MYDVLDQQTDYAILGQLASSPGKFHVARQPSGRLTTCGNVSQMALY